MKANAIWIDTEIGKKALRMVEADEAAELIPCAIKRLCDGIAPSGKSEAFMQAYEYLLTGVEVVHEEE